MAVELNVKLLNWRYITVINCRWTEQARHPCYVHSTFDYRTIDYLFTATHSKCGLKERKQEKKKKTNREKKRKEDEKKKKVKEN